MLLNFDKYLPTKKQLELLKKEMQGILIHETEYEYITAKSISSDSLVIYSGELFEDGEAEIKRVTVY